MHTSNRKTKYKPIDVERVGERLYIELPETREFESIVIQPGKTRSGLKAGIITRREEFTKRKRPMFPSGGATRPGPLELPDVGLGNRSESFNGPEPTGFYEHYMPAKITIPMSLITMLWESGLRTRLFDHAAMLAYIYGRYKRDKHRPRGIPTWHSDWCTVLRLNERWAKAAQRRLVTKGLLLVRFGVNMGKRCNRYVVSNEIALVLDPRGAKLIPDELNPNFTFEFTGCPSKRGEIPFEDVFAPPPD